MRTLNASLFAVLICACPPPAGSPTLSISAQPRAIDDMGGKTVINLSATAADGTPGTGTVTVTAATGTIDEGSVTLDSSGEATSHFSCNVTQNISCSGKVDVTAKWNAVTADTHVQVGDAGMVTGAGGGSNTPDAGDAGASGGGDAGLGDGGSNDAGANDGGGDGGFFDAGAVPFHADAGAVLLFGTLVESTAQLAICSLSTPTNASVGMLPGANRQAAQLTADGRLVYLDTQYHLLRIFVPDPFEQVAAMTSRYPTDGGRNELTLPTPACDGGSPVSMFWLRPDSDTFVYECGGDGFFFEGGGKPDAGSPQDGQLENQSLSLLAAGYNGTFIATSLQGDYTFDVDGGEHEIFGIDNTLQTLATSSRWRDVRAVDGGFLFTRAPMGADDGECNLWFVTAGGTATQLGTFVELVGASNLLTTCQGRIDRAGNLYTPGKSSQNDDVVIARQLVLPAGSSSIAYTDQNAVPTQYTSYPPHVFTFLDSTSGLVTGP